MNWTSWLFWGFIATLLLSTLSAMTQGLGLTRLNLPYLLGTTITPNRDKARLYGFLMHLASGWFFSLLYVIAFQLTGAADWWRGVVIGIIHALAVLAIAGSVLPGLHPRMASEEQGPEPNRDLEPPGFMVVNYGLRTPVAVIATHALFGAILGTFYVLK